MKSLWTVAAAMLLSLSLTVPEAAFARGRILQCVPFARQVSGIEIYGNAKTWWGQAAGRYERGSQPRVGSVMAMPGHGRMRLGHVATVSQIVSDRELLLTHANWSRRGGIERNVRAIDVSEKGDWSRVRVWFAGNGDLGTTSYPVSGFIYPKAATSVGLQMALAQPLKTQPVQSLAAKPVIARGPLLSDEVLALAEREKQGLTLAAN
jgi:surface antigen